MANTILCAILQALIIATGLLVVIMATQDVIRKIKEIKERTENDKIN